MNDILGKIRKELEVVEITEVEDLKEGDEPVCGSHGSK